MKPAQFRRQSLALFFIVTLIPALVVAAIWYVNVQTGDGGPQVLDFETYVLPVIVLGILPAMALSFAFAELLARPVRRIHEAARDLADGNFSSHFEVKGAGEFRDIGQALDRVASQMKQVLSEASSETALIEAERNKLRGVLNSMTDGVFALDNGGRIILFNKAASQLTGRTIESVAGQLAEKVMPFRQHGELVMTRWLASQSNDDQQVSHWPNLELYRADGASLFVNVQAVVLPADPNGIRALVTFHDITATQQLEQMKVDFVALAAHELRTPLTEIRGYLDILQHEAKGLTKDNRKFLDRSMETAGQLTSLVNNLLNVSRIEHGEVNFSPQPLNYIEFVEDLAKGLALRAKEQDRKLELSLPVELPVIGADASALREVIMNLVDNAMKYTENGKGRVTISVKRHRDQIETSITDNGPGISTSDQTRLFSKFFRVDEMRNKVRGTGLGLYICKAIVEAHGGHIWVESEEGNGSSFIFRLPIKPIAGNAKPEDNTDKITRGTHGWIKKHSIR
jgi:two-component system phosphate regulon sensor histidine kinase PhoR